MADKILNTATVVYRVVDGEVQFFAIYKSLAAADADLDCQLGPDPTDPTLRQQGWKARSLILVGWAARMLPDDPVPMDVREATLRH